LYYITLTTEIPFKVAKIIKRREIVGIISLTKKGGNNKILISDRPFGRNYAEKTEGEKR